MIKEAIQFTFSVEGDTEKWYLEWLKESINASSRGNIQSIIQL